jgi:hypothetical protein
MKKFFWSTGGFLTMCAGVLLLLYIVTPHPAVVEPPTAPTGPIGIRYLAVNATCAPSQSAAYSMIRALREKDMEAIQGLMDRGKIFMLTVGTRFEVSDYRTAGFAWGFVRSGHEVGRDCYLPTVALR